VRQAAALESYLDNWYGLPQSAGENVNWLPSVSPILVELEAGLVPSDGTEDWPLIKQHLPAMRERLLGEMGVQVPGVRVRDGDLLPRNYVILLDEIPVATGTVQPNMRFCPLSADRLAKLGVSTTTLMEAPHPMTGQLGCWVDHEAWARFESLSVELWPDPLIYVVYHLESVLRQNLADFLGFQETQNWLDNWGKSPGIASLAKTILPDQTSRWHFAHLLRDLVRENVPIIAREDLLRSLQDISFQGENSRETALCAARLALKKYLPGNGPAATRLALPEWVENKTTSYIRTDDGKAYLALPRSEAREILRQIRLIMRASSREQALVTRSGWARPFVRRLVRTEFPSLAVLSREEVLAPDTILYPV
jgi:type III secretory pathway component EscV